MSPAPNDDGPTPPSVNDTLDARVSTQTEAAELRSDWVVAARYEIVSLLGSGGMGTVYRARDRELDEAVALKMLRKGVTSAAEDLERFRREVKLARRVTHHNIARTFDIGAHAGARFLTMELIEGEMLGALLTRRGRLPVAEVVVIGRQLCDGLSAAHAARVLHRDLKPENVIIATDGRAVITDFGIARALMSRETLPGTGVMGTPAYMAPEQLEGAALDERADIYALGAMLFEMLAGVQAWVAETPMGVAMARLRLPPPDVRALRPSLSPASAAVIKKLMARRPEDRFSSAAEVSAALDVFLVSAPSTPTVRPAASSHRREVVQRKLAILPLRNDGPSEDEYLAEGLTEDLIDVLEDIPGLRVSPRGVVYSGVSTSEPRAAGRALGVESVVAGTLRREGDRVLVSLRLVTIEDGLELWARRFDPFPAYMMAVADLAADEIARALTTKPGARPRPLATHPVADDLYLRGRYVFNRGWFDAGGAAVRLLGEAHALSPANPMIAGTYARALARSYGMESLGEAAARAAQQVAEGALAIDPTATEAHLALATVHLYRGEGAAAADALRRAVSTAPTDPNALDLLGRLRAEVGPLRAAVDQLTAALEREPGLADARYTLARALTLLGDRQGATAALSDSPTQLASLVPHFLTKARLLMWHGDREGASALIQALEGVDLQAPTQRSILDMLLSVCVRRALRDEERACLQAAFPGGSTKPQRLAAFDAQMRAEVHLAAGDDERGVEAIIEADANGLLDLCWLEQCPLLSATRGRRELEAVTRSTARRAARVRDVLDAPDAG